MNPAALPSFASSTTHISAHVDACGRGFISLAAALTNDQRFAAQARPEAINDEFDRFKIWAGNIAAHRKGRRSLEYRLRDAAHLKVETHNLLKALQDSLTNALAIVKGERTPWDELSDSDSDSESDSEPLGDAGEDFQSDTELKQLSASIKNTVTCLFRLSMAIRDPAPNTQSRSFITVDKSYYETHDILHVQSKFPQSDDFLTERLGRAISGRRQYLTYREEHHQKLTKNIEKIGHEEPKTEHTTNSTEASPMPVLDTKVTTVVDDSFDTLSQTSYATSVNATIRAPPLPKEAKEKEHFECPLCYMIVSIHTTAGWKQHVYRDLHPFCCTYEHCTTADRLYDSRRSWFTHELAHRTSWQCIEGCNESFRSEKEFVAHVQASHPDLAADKVISALKHTAEKSANLSEHAKCPLCSKQMTLRALQKHLGHHQEQLSLFALPPNLDETEDDPLDDEVENPVDVAKWQDEELSDISDAADASDDLDVGMENEDLSTTDIGSSSVPWGATPETPLGKLAAIALHFHTEIVPPIEAFIKNPPTDEQTRLSGYSHFSQRILNEVLEVASNVKTDGNYDASLRYNALSTEVNGLLASLSDAMNIVFDPHDRLPLMSDIDLKSQVNTEERDPGGQSQASSDLIKDSVSAMSRPVNTAESWAAYDFEMHARNCAYCNNPYEVHRTHSQLCDVGHRLAQDVAHLIYNRTDGLTYSTVLDEDQKLVRVKLPAGYDQARGLLKAIERSLRHRSRTQFVFQDRAYNASEGKSQAQSIHDPVSSHSESKSSLPSVVPPIVIEEEEDSIIKCICGYISDDGNTVLCEICNTWQHIICYYESVHQVPDVHECASCVPRHMSRQAAAEKQRRLREQRPELQSITQDKTTKAGKDMAAGDDAMKAFGGSITPNIQREDGGSSAESLQNPNAATHASENHPPEPVESSDERLRGTGDPSGIAKSTKSTEEDTKSGMLKRMHDIISAKKEFTKQVGRSVLEASSLGTRGNSQTRLTAQKQPLREDERVRLARKADIERRCQLLETPIPPHLLRHMASFNTAVQDFHPIDDHFWSVLEPQLSAQLPVALQADMNYATRGASAPPNPSTAHTETPHSPLKIGPSTTMSQVTFDALHQTGEGTKIPAKEEEENEQVIVETQNAIGQDMKTPNQNKMAVATISRADLESALQQGKDAPVKERLEHFRIILEQIKGRQEERKGNEGKVKDNIHEDYRKMKEIRDHVQQMQKFVQETEDRTEMMEILTEEILAEEMQARVQQMRHDGKGLEDGEREELINMEMKAKRMLLQNQRQREREDAPGHVEEYRLMDGYEANESIGSSSSAPQPDMNTHELKQQEANDQSDNERSFNIPNESPSLTLGGTSGDNVLAETKEPVQATSSGPTDIFDVAVEQGVLRQEEISTQELARERVHQQDRQQRIISNYTMAPGSTHGSRQATSTARGLDGQRETFSLPPPPTDAAGNFASKDEKENHQTQLMLLEQQKKKQLLQFRQEHGDALTMPLGSEERIKARDADRELSKQILTLSDERQRLAGLSMVANASEPGEIALEKNRNNETRQEFVGEAVPRRRELTTEQRKNASLMRKLGSCYNCKSRRTKCDPETPCKSCLEHYTEDERIRFPCRPEKVTQEVGIRRDDTETSMPLSTQESRVNSAHAAMNQRSASGEIRLRVDASAPLNLQFNGDMEGRSLQIDPPEDGMADIVIGGPGSLERREVSQPKEVGSKGKGKGKVLRKAVAREIGELHVTTPDKKPTSTPREEDNRNRDFASQRGRNVQPTHLPPPPPTSEQPVLQRPSIPADKDFDEDFDEEREETTRQAWQSLRANRELKEQQRLEALRQKAEDEWFEAESSGPKVQGDAGDYPDAPGWKAEGKQPLELEHGLQKAEVVRLEGEETIHESERLGVLREEAALKDKRKLGFEKFPDNELRQQPQASTSTRDVELEGFSDLTVNTPNRQEILENIRIWPGMHQSETNAASVAMANEIAKIEIQGPPEK